MVVPSSLTVEQLREIVRLAGQTAADLAGGSFVPQSFASFPINAVGSTALILISSTMPDKLADGIEGNILLNMMAAFRFMRQILDRVAGRVPMKRDEYVFSVVSYCIKFTPHFADALKLRLPILVKQAMDATPPVLEMAQRLSRLSDIALTTIATLRDIIGSESYDRWLERRNTPRFLQIDPPRNAIEREKEEEKEEEERKQHLPSQPFGKGKDTEKEKEESADLEKLATKTPPSHSPSKMVDVDKDEEEYDEEDEDDDLEFDIQSGESGPEDTDTDS